MNWRNWLLYCLIIGVTLLGAELLARTYDWRPRSGDFAVGDNLGMGRYYHAPGGFGDLQPGQDGHWVTWFHRPYHVQTNSVGLRNTEEPADEAFRILAVGDSQTFGPYLANEDTWPAWTENYLRQRQRTASRTQVFNAGIAGYTIADELAYVKEKGVALKPKLVVLAVFENDLFDLRKERDGALQRPAEGLAGNLGSAIKGWARHSAFVGLADQLRKRIDFARANIDVRRGEGPVAGADSHMLDASAHAARYTELFREMVKLLKSRGIALAVIFIPASDLLADGAVSTTEPVIQAAAAATGTPYFNLLPAFRAQQDPIARLYLLQGGPTEGWTGNGHLSREGNAVIGRTVADWLTERKLVP
jgi:lysophospholipase L1-like esterase